MSCGLSHFSSFFFFNDTATTEIYTLSLHDALPICPTVRHDPAAASPPHAGTYVSAGAGASWYRSAAARGCSAAARSEEHTSELQSRSDLVCRLLLEKKKKVPT